MKDSSKGTDDYEEAKAYLQKLGMQDVIDDNDGFTVVACAKYYMEKNNVR